MKISNENMRCLIEILARTDAVWLPIREWTQGHRGATTSQARMNFRKAGVQWHGSGDGPNNRKGAQEIRQALAAAGLVRLLKRKSDRTVGHLLTSAGEAIARAATGLPQIAEGMPLLDRLWELRTDPAGLDLGDYHWARETTLDPQIDYALTDNRPERQKIMDLENKMLPALIRAWAISNSCNHGNVQYGISHKLTDKPSVVFKLSEPPPGLPKSSARHIEVYNVAIKQALTALELPPPNPQEIGFIALNVSWTPRGGWAAIKETVSA